MYLLFLAWSLINFLNSLTILNKTALIPSDTYQRIKDNTGKHWAFLKFELIKEYSLRPSLPPPLQLFQQIYYYCRPCRDRDTDSAFRKSGVIAMLVIRICVCFWRVTLWMSSDLLYWHFDFQSTINLGN